MEREVDTEDADTMFYITLTIEEDRPGTGVTLVPGHGASQDSDVDSNTYSHMSSDSSGSRLVSQRRGRSNYSIVRPGVPPPAPPIRTVTSVMSTDTSEASEASDQGESLSSNTGSHTDSLLLCDSLKVSWDKCVYDQITSFDCVCPLTEQTVTLIFCVAGVLCGYGGL